MTDDNFVYDWPLERPEIVWEWQSEMMSNPHNPIEDIKAAKKPRCINEPKEWTPFEISMVSLSAIETMNRAAREVARRWVI